MIPVAAGEARSGGPPGPEAAGALELERSLVSGATSGHSCFTDQGEQLQIGPGQSS